MTQSRGTHGAGAAGAADGAAGAGAQPDRIVAAARAAAQRSDRGAAGARGEAAPAGEAAGRDRAPHQRTERTAQEALREPVHARTGRCDLLRSIAPRDREQGHRQFPNPGRQEAIW